MTKVTRVRLRIIGRVQGVGFRYFIEREAKRLGLAGWVRNLTDGSVEAEAEGARSELTLLVDAARRGPGTSRVVSVEEAWSEGAPQHTTFRMLADSRAG